MITVLQSRTIAVSTAGAQRRHQHEVLAAEAV